MDLLAESVRLAEEVGKHRDGAGGVTQPMKIRASEEAGNTLLVVLLIAGLLTAAIGTYLNLTMQEHKLVKRSLGWNAALPMAEAGIEEVLTHLNKNTSNYTAEGWT